MAKLLIYNKQTMDTVEPCCGAAKKTFIGYQGK